MCPPNLKSVAVAIPETLTKFQNLKVDQNWPRLWPLWPTFVSLIFFSLQPFERYSQGSENLKSRSRKLGQAPFDLVLACHPNYPSVDAHTKFKVYSFSRPIDIRIRMLKIWALSAILDSTRSGFSQFCLFHRATSIILLNLNTIRPCVAELEQRNHFSNCCTLWAPIGTMDVRVEEP